MTDGQMIARMARENSARRIPGIPDIREAIAAAVEAHGKGLILPSEMKIKNPKMLRYAPSYAIGGEKVDSTLSQHPYTVQALADFLGFLQPDKTPKQSFEAAFGAEELIAEKIWKESDVRGQTAEKLGELWIGPDKRGPR